MNPDSIHEGMICPVPLDKGASVLLAHGGGGSLMRRLIGEFLEVFGAPAPGDRHDGAMLDAPRGRIAFTTDSYVIRPLSFPGGDIGSLAVFGTVNDLSVCGAVPLWLSAGFILEEGFPLSKLRDITRSIAGAARAAGVGIVTGDTKVVERGKCDGIYINTAGIGSIPDGVDVRPSRIRPGDSIVINGDVGRHGITIMSLREGIDLDTGLESDLAPVNAEVAAMISTGVDVRCMRDLTRGGLAAALTEIAGDSGLDILLDEAAVPVDRRVAAACELLGFDPLHVANEGRFVAFVPPDGTARIIDAVASCRSSSRPCVIGTVLDTRGKGVIVRNNLGTTRPLAVFSGEQLPRIC